MCTPLKKLVAVIFVFASFVQSHADILIDDFEGGTATNKIYTQWSFTGDVREGGSSVITNAGPAISKNDSVVGWEFSGAYGPGYQSRYCGEINFEVDYDHPSAYVGLTTNLDDLNLPVDLSETDGIQFKVKGTELFDMKFKIISQAASGPAVHYADFSVDYSWETVTIYYEDLLGSEVLNIEKVISLQWVYEFGEDGPVEATVSVDDILLLGSLTGFPVPAPVLVSPANLSTECDIPVTLDWEQVPGATAYELIVRTVQEDYFLNEKNITETEFTISGLSKSTTYDWKVRAFRDGDTSDWSRVNEFTTVSSSLTKPVLISSSDAASGDSPAKLLQWEPVEGAQSYSIQVSRNLYDYNYDLVTGKYKVDYSSDLVVDMYDILTDTQIVHLPSWEKRYYWRVRAMNDEDTSAWSTSQSFDTDVPVVLPLSPGLFAPADLAVNQPTSPKLHWNASTGADSYTIEVSDISSFNSVVYRQVDVDTTCVTVSSLTHGTDYYWRVKANSTVGSSEWSAAWSFTTADEEPNGSSESVQLKTPVDGDVVRMDIVPLLWYKGLEENARYIVEVANDSTMENASADTLSDTLMLLSLDRSGAQYWWRVKAYGPEGWGGFSEKRCFTADLLSPITGHQFEQPEFNFLTDGNIVRYALPTDCHVRARLYTLNGRLIADIFNGMQKAGTHRQSLSQYPKGVYIFVLDAAEKQFRTKIVSK